MDGEIPAVNLLIGSDDIAFATGITTMLALELNLTRVKYVYMKPLNTPAECVKEPWIIAGHPSTAAEYRQLCADGFSPDLVFWVHPTRPPSTDTELFYEGRVSTIIGDSFWVTNEIKKAIQCEIECSRA